MFQEYTEKIKSFDGNQLFFRLYTPAIKNQLEINPDGVVLAVHGFAEHSGRYSHLAELVCSKNLAFAIFDIRGHGRSGPIRGDAENLHAFILDIIFMSDHVKKIFNINANNKKFFGLLGHSFGSLLVTYALAHMNYSSLNVFLSSPCYSVKQKIPKWKQLIANNLSKYLPNLFVPTGISPNSLSNNPKNNQAAQNDKEILKIISARMGYIFLSAVDESKIINAIQMIKNPIKIVAASDDKLVDVEKTKKYVSYFNNSDTTLKVIQGAGHEIFNEILVYQKEALHEFAMWLESKNDNFGVE
jgi:alpha-beta hydrolase superfamily lysophospholipase